jgi:uncharacterized protein YndB with AHSA1/START domain
MLAWIAILVIAAVAVILGFAASRPGSFRVARTDFIEAPPEKVFVLINDFHLWQQWSPWEKLDPAMTRALSGTTNGVGAIYNWSGNKKVGEGRMEIASAEPPARLVIKLEFVKPWKASNTVEFILNGRADGTEVTWSMMGASPFMFKLMGLFMNMDQMIGGDFERGLANLKAAVGSANGDASVQ